MFSAAPQTFYNTVNVDALQDLESLLNYDIIYFITIRAIPNHLSVAVP